MIIGLKIIEYFDRPHVLRKNGKKCALERHLDFIRQSYRNLIRLFLFFSDEESVVSLMANEEKKPFSSGILPY